MRVFVTGASGYIGTALVRTLVQAGHEVGGLVRSDEKMELVKRLGAVPIRGNLRDVETYQHFAAESQAVVHTAFETPAEDGQAVESLLSALQAEGGQKTFVYTSGVWVHGPTEGGDERSELRPPVAVAWRPSIEQQVLRQSGQRGLVTSVVRPGIVYGGKGGIIGSFFSQAAAGGPVRFLGDGRARWAPIHRDDLAALYRLVVEKRATGVFLGVDGSAPTVRQIAEACAKAAGTGAKVEATPLEQARLQMGPLADALEMDQVVRSTRAGEIGWTRKHPEFLRDVDDAWREWQQG